MCKVRHRQRLGEAARRGREEREGDAGVPVRERAEVPDRGGGERGPRVRVRQRQQPGAGVRGADGPRGARAAARLAAAVGGAGVREARRGVREGRPAGGRVQEGRRVRAQLWRQLSRQALRVISSFSSFRGYYFGQYDKKMEKQM